MDLVGLGAKRGDILGAGGLALVTDRPVVRIGIDRSQVGAAKAGASAREVARLVDIDAGGVREAGRRPPGRWRSSRRSSTARTRCRAAC